MQARTQEIELLELQIKRKKSINHTANLAIGIIDSSNLIAIFAMFLKEVWIRLLEETARFILFPVAAALAVIRATLAWRQAYLEKGKKGTLTHAIVETVTAAAICVAVIGGFVAASIFATIAPLIFSITMGAKALFHMGAACYYWGKSRATENEEKKLSYRQAMQGHAVGAVALSLATVAIVMVMLLAKPIMAILGITAGAIATLYSGHKFINTSIPPKDYEPLPQNDNSLRSEPNFVDRSYKNNAFMKKTIKNAKERENSFQALTHSKEGSLQTPNHLDAKAIPAPRISGVTHVSQVPRKEQSDSPSDAWNNVHQLMAHY